MTFDLEGPLPTGTVVLEASAGTGKTYTIAGLVTRYIAEDVARIDQLLAVTFGRGATSELRTRVRERLQTTHAALAPGAGTSADPVVRVLASADVAARRERIGRALAGFDTATVATVHEFCLRVLTGLGSAGRHDSGATLVEGLDEVADEVGDDLLLGWSLRAPGGTLPLDRGTASGLARAAVRDREALLLPMDAPRDSAAWLRQSFAGRARGNVEQRAERVRLLSFDELLARVRDALADPVSGPVARERLLASYRVVLVDEFQDTDPVQWEVLERAFHGERPLVIIGDPKQAIYGFRGADVRAYLRASQVGIKAGLGTNWRSDELVLRDLDRLFRTAALGHPEIRFGHVDAGRTSVGLLPANPTPVRVRVVPREGHRAARNGLVVVDVARDLVADDVADQVVATLAEDLKVVDRETAETRELRPQDVAVLVRTGNQAEKVREALAERGVPCVVSLTRSVFSTDAANEWVRLLEALGAPHRTGTVRRLALSPWVGRTAEQLLDEAGEQETGALADQLRGWAQVLADDGVAALFTAVQRHTDLAARLLGQRDGERLLTDLRHIAESLHAEARQAQLGAAGLLSWLRDRITDAAADDVEQERARRLDTDADAVQLMTVHAAKGLEWPVVLVPYGWDATGQNKKEKTPRGHADDGTRTLYVGGKTGPGYDAACAAQAVEEAGEDLRLFYVACTRAASRLLLWWVGGNTDRGPLTRLLLADDLESLPDSVSPPADDKLLARLAELGLTGEVARPGSSAGAVVAAASGGLLSAASFDRSIDTAWTRTSYTALTSRAHEHAGVTSEPDAPVKADEPELESETAAAAGDEALRDVPSPMALLPGGTAFGTLVHEVLEDADLTSADLEAELVEVAASRLASRATEVSAVDLGAGLVPAVRTPLGSLAGGRSLADLGASDVLKELSFELPLRGGDAASRPPLRVADIADLLEQHLPADDPVLPYAADLRLVGAPDVRGYLAGAIDVVVRVDGRYLVVDHKTNRLARRDEDLTAWHYRRTALDEAVRKAHYPLQALIYDVALHRYLRWRLRGYDPQEHLGGVLYLFLRGMCGPGVDAGVWSWRPPAALVTDLSDLLAGT